MASSQLELIRLNHELAERCEMAVTLELDVKPNGQKAKVWQQHRLKQMVDGIVSANTQLQAQYEDKDSMLSDELAYIIGDGSKGGMGGMNGKGGFYDSLRSTLEYHQKHPMAHTAPQKLGSEVVVGFSGEEVFGKYLDLHQMHLLFSNAIRSVPGMSLCLLMLFSYSIIVF
jgi:splicing factor 3A subunit 3